jgi:hypothetical protein
VLITFPRGGGGESVPEPANHLLTALDAGDTSGGVTDSGIVCKPATLPAEGDKAGTGHPIYLSMNLVFADISGCVGGSGNDCKPITFLGGGDKAGPESSKNLLATSSFGGISGVSDLLTDRMSPMDFIIVVNASAFRAVGEGAFAVADARPRFFVVGGSAPRHGLPLPTVGSPANTWRCSSIQSRTALCSLIASNVASRNTSYASGGQDFGFVPALAMATAFSSSSSSS